MSGTDTRLVYYYLPPVDYSGSFKATVDLVYEQNGFLRWRRNTTTKNAPSGWLIDNCLLGKAATESVSSRATLRARETDP